MQWGIQSRIRCTTSMLFDSLFLFPGYCQTVAREFDPLCFHRPSEIGIVFISLLEYVCHFLPTQHIVPTLCQSETSPENQVSSSGVMKEKFMTEKEMRGRILKMSSTYTRSGEHTMMNLFPFPTWPSIQVSYLCISRFSSLVQYILWTLQWSQGRSTCSVQTLQRWSFFGLFV